MSLVPGGSEKDIPPGGQIKYTQAPVSLENLIGQMIFSQPGGHRKSRARAGSAPGRTARRRAPPDGAAPGAPAVSNEPPRRAEDRR